MFLRIPIIVAAASVCTLATLVVGALADDLGAIAGVWALDKEACRIKPSDFDDRLKVTAVGKNGGSESDCRASTIRSAGSRIQFQNACLSEGERSKSKVTVEVASPDRITWREGKAPPTTYVRCDGVSGAQQKAQVAATASSFETGSFSLSSHGYSATITSLTGADTQNATMTGQVTRADATEECERNSPGGEGLKPKALQKCVAETMKAEAGKTHTATADCKARTIVASFGGRFTIVGVDEYGSARIFDSKRQDIGGTTASGAPSIQGQFEKLCPAMFEKLKRKGV
ncbi:hypothetical protein MKK64_03095 [Methylobacterium sp. E-025]|uniref:hypothetical protein n=1 Tax=Methylobacterium sp. E-025 TaxID=2836561 RepID=UPI001FB8ADD5|nr:hypothetical protein [Methylobacterium sp. E-025]MCJ2110207.1 hypothetical protein [Methylobacterium sp. E-025]